MQCPLCHQRDNLSLDNIYFECHNCGGIYMDKLHYVDSATERARYEEHHNDPNDPGYQKFVSPITEHIINHFDSDSVGLDFGSGTGPVISKVLSEKNYQLNKYDPFFYPDTSVLYQKYHFIACCEVIEHFKQPEKEFNLLYDLLYPGGKLLCMTKLYNESIPFQNWYYRRDPTHVFIYQSRTITYLTAQFGFKNGIINGRLIIFEK